MPSYASLALWPLRYACLCRTFASRPAGLADALTANKLYFWPESSGPRQQWIVTDAQAVGR